MNRTDVSRQRPEGMHDTAAALHTMVESWRRLNEFGWRDILYCPKDGSWFDAIEAGNTGIHRCQYSGEWPNGHWWIKSDGDLWPARPILWRPLGAGDEPTREQGGGGEPTP